MYQVISLLGDSIANGYWDEDGLGWFGRLRMKICKAVPFKYGFNNLAESGDKSIHVLTRLTANVLLRKPDILMIAVGVNDIIRTGSRSGPFDLSLNYAFKTWRKIMSLAKNNITTTIIIGLLCTQENSMPSEESEDSLYNNNIDISDYNNSLKNLANEFGFKFIDLSNLWPPEKAVNFTVDGIHPNAIGHAMIADLIYTELESLNLISSI